MKLIKPSVEILNPEYYTTICKGAKTGSMTLENDPLDVVYKQIEVAGRTCYKSEDRITDDSAKKFVDMIIERGHTAMLEHGTVYLYIEEPNGLKYSDNKYSVCNYNGNEHKYYITTNYRVLLENNWLDDLEYICLPTKHHEKRVSVRWICDRGVSHELVRHRVFSFAQESTRYCNYSKDKFNNEITFIQPTWLDNTDTDKDSRIFNYHLRECENRYFNLLNECNWQPQQARAVLPNALKTEVVMTGFLDD